MAFGQISETNLGHRGTLFVGEARNIRLTLAYDGGPFCGWQVQPGRPTIQGALEAAVLTVSGERVRLLSAGRTDSGVHALGQVANFFSSAPLPPEKWRPALQAQLPPEIVILRSDAVPPEFHATFSAVSKRYRYLIRNSLVDDPFTRRYCWRISQPLEHRLMHEAAQRLLGRHDFRSFESDWPNKATSIRTIFHLSVTRAKAWPIWQPDASAGLAVQATQTHGADVPGSFTDSSTEANPPDLDSRTIQSESAGTDPGAHEEFIIIDIEADGFLYNMVRAITGTLVNVGRGTWTANDVERVLHAQNRSLAGATAPAQGLYLMQVHYPEDLSVRQPRHDLE